MRLHNPTDNDVSFIVYEKKWGTTISRNVTIKAGETMWMHDDNSTSPSIHMALTLGSLVLANEPDAPLPDPVVPKAEVFEPKVESFHAEVLLEATRETEEQSTEEHLTEPIAEEARSSNEEEQVALNHEAEGSNPSEPATPPQHSHSHKKSGRKIKKANIRF